MMNDNIFDKQVKSALEQIEPPFDPASWQALDQRLNASLPDEGPVAVDQTVFNGLQGMEVPFHAADWEKMNAKLNLQIRLRRRMWITKFAEAAIFLLFLANLDGLLKYGPGGPDKNTQTQSSETLAAGTTKARHKNSGGNGSAAHSIHHDSKTGYGNFWDTNTVSDNNQTTENQVDNSNVVFVSERSNIPEVPETQFVSNENRLVSILNPIPVLTSTLPLAWVMDPSHFPMILIKSPKENHLYLAAGTAFDNNYIRNGSDFRKANGVSAKINVGYRKGKWGAETGLAYSRKTYTPKREVEIYVGNVADGYWGSFAEKISADLVSVPVKMTRQVAKAGKTTAHVVAGATANFVVQKDYKYKKVFYPGSAPSSLGAPGAPQLQKEGKGLLENGNIDDNFYATADAGLRIEHPIGRRIKAFVEPVYSAALSSKGIGPKPSRLSTFSVQAGIMASL